MAFTDRVVEYPGRVVLTAVSGETDTYDMTFSEGTVTEEGTPLDADSMNTEITSMINEAMSGITIDSSGNVSYRNMQSGRVQVTPTAVKSVKSVQVTFPTAFTKTPFVVATPITAGPNIVAVSVGSVTTTGFILYMYRTTKVTTGVMWQAHV